MSAPSPKSLNVFAPAKINLYLHITGRLNNGYHTLDSLVAFADIGDNITIEPAAHFSFTIDGPYASFFEQSALDAGVSSSNLVVRAALALAKAAEKEPNIHITLTKNLPIAAGIGGGSSDAAATLWGLMELWGIPAHASFLPEIMAMLGADVPVCLPCAPARMRGIGDRLSRAPDMAETPILLVNPSKSCLTAGIFRRFSSPYKQELASLPEDLSSFEALIGFLNKNGNDLYAPACAMIPDIQNVIHALRGQDGCALARLSGSGATCFGLFEDESAAQMAARIIAEDNPDWWVRAGWLNRPQRY